MSAAVHKRVLPGFGISFGIAWAYVGLLVLIPLAALVLKTLTLAPAEIWEAVTSPRALASYRLSFGAALLAAGVNAVFGVAIAWVLVRYRFPGRGVIDALVDLPFALPTAVAGLTLTALYAESGLFGEALASLGFRVAYAVPGVVIALIFVGLPFVVRTVQPVLEDLDPAVEEAAATLGASRWQVLRKVVLPNVLPAALNGFTLAFARAVGEYGSVVFISGNLPLRTEITPFLIVTRLEQYDYGGAAALAVVMLAVSLLLLVAINVLQRWATARSGRGGA